MGIPSFPNALFPLVTQPGSALTTSCAGPTSVVCLSTGGTGALGFRMAFRNLTFGHGELSLLIRLVVLSRFR